MLTLCKIRYMYIRKNLFILAIYLIIPIIAIIFYLPASIINSKKERKKDYSMISNIQHNQYNNFLNKDFISNDLNNSAIIVNKIENGKKLSEFIKNKTNIKLNYYLEENELNITNYQNFIEKEGKSNFYLKIKEKTNFFNIHKIRELKKISNYIYSFFSYNEDSDIKVYLQSLIGEYLENENIINFAPNITINPEFKSFNSLDNKKSISKQTTDDIFIGVVISLEMSFLIHFLTERITEEKEKKLKDLLERLGISKKKYILSWLVTISLFSIEPLVAFMCFGGYYFVYRYPFFLINLILYMLSTYSFICFILVIISSLKIGTTIIKIFNFTTIFLGAALSIPKIGRIVKIIFFIIPNVNIYYTVGVLFTISKKNIRMKPICLLGLKIYHFWNH